RSLIARQWPVDAVIGENGAFAFYEVDGVLKELVHPEAVGSAERLAEVEKAVLERVPGSRVAKDQPYRRFDLAVDFREEEPDLGFEAARVIRQVFEEHGAVAKVSSIHVNGWFGNYNKLSMTELFVKQLWEESLSDSRERYVFVGDSPNDAPMFAYFPHSIGVANVARFADSISALPTYLARGEGGLGFAEAAAALLSGLEAET
ncbi:MAG: HAD family hydrolase, partial [Myxococcota bacterium]